MAPSVAQMATHFGTSVPGADAIHTITVDDAHMARTILLSEELLVGVMINFIPRSPGAELVIRAIEPKPAAQAVA
jgi:hypothetical protein